MSSIALAPSRWAINAHRVRSITNAPHKLGALLRFADPAHTVEERRRSAGRFVAAALTVALFGGSVSSAAAALTSPLRDDPTLAWESAPEPSPPPVVAGIPPQVETAPAEPAAEPAPPAKALPLPSGKGMWIWQPDKIFGGDPHAIVAKAVEKDLTHLFVRTGSSWQGFHGAGFLDQILPVAHAAGIRIYGWDFPKLADPVGDAHRGITAVHHTTPGGHRIDGFVPDIETSHEGTQMSVEAVRAYNETLRNGVGPNYPLVVAVPRPSAAKLATYPYDVVVEHYDGIAPMVYWLNRQPDTDIAETMAALAKYNKPVLPIGQAYEGLPEGGRPGLPPADEINRFMSSAEQHGAVSVSFWSYQHADDEIWDAIGGAREFSLRPVPASELHQGEVRSVQHLLTGLGYPAPSSGLWDDQTRAAVTQFQTDAHLQATGQLDPETVRIMLTPAPVAGL